MDSFDNRVKEMQDEITEMKRNITQMKSNNTSTMNHIKYSINNLSRSNIKQISKSRTSLNTPISTNTNNNNNQCTTAASFRTVRRDKKDPIRLNNTPHHTYHKKRINSEVFKLCLQKMEPIYSERKSLLHYDNTNNNNKDNTCSILNDTNTNNINNTFQFRNSQNVMKRSNSNKPVNQKLYMLKQHSAYDVVSYDIDDNRNSKYKRIVDTLVQILQTQVNVTDHTVTEDTLINDFNAYINSNTSNAYILSQLKLIYNRKHNLNDNDYVDNKKLFQWLAVEKNEKCFQEDNLNEYIQYKEYFDSIMKKFRLNNLQEMKMFINECLSRQNKNDQFVIGMKKILCEEFKTTRGHKGNNNNNNYNK